MSRLPRPCLGCGALVPSGSRCPRCQSAWEARRGTTTQRGYGTAWQKMSARVVAEERACRVCGTTGTPDNPLTADHIVPKTAGGGDGRTNAQCLCRRHNSSKGGRR